ncbi:hypothetical protein ATO10_10685 [Actibacterium atlanticum]|uniref:Metallo-beta-lactamase domain-containing protein n=1 Tax=Actibacterium atlanticum TaxID=1461693 RepID=A0A058ZLY3_9RHOB|nr:MBL fold metallo-hydrolase [Actibacterium atlanticum]KCV81806.1 hypothetical protein ATO10_10685 [Actibacterium atlanticum]
MTLSRRSFLSATAALPLATTLTAAPVRAMTSQASTQVAGIHRTRIGDSVVTALLDGYVDLPTGVLSSFDEAQVSGAFADYGHKINDGHMRIPVNGYLIETGEKKILVDAGAADLFAPTLGSLTANLKAAGVTPDQIDMVLLTHLHVDHVGALIDGEGNAVFPNAEVAVAQSEWDFWYDDAMMAAGGEEAAGFFQAARATTTPYKDRLKLFSGEADLGAGITTMPLPGHTPGHSGFTLSSGDDSLLFWGDIVHLTGLQFTHPELTVAFDMDRDQTLKTRAKMMDMAATDKLLVTGMHVDFPGWGQVLRAGDAYRYQASPWNYAV